MTTGADTQHGPADRYVPAAGRAFLTPFYDRAMSLTMREGRWRPRVAHDVTAGLRPGATIVDVGCGTGTQAVELAQLRPDVDVVGVDGDAEALRIAGAKSGADRVRWMEGTADRLPLEDRSVDRVVVSLLLHHLSPHAKLEALAECRRVLGEGGVLQVVDFGRPQGLVARAGFTALRMLDGWKNTKAHADGDVSGLLVEAGFGNIRLLQVLPTVFGTLERLTATPDGRTPAFHRAV